MTHYQTLGVDRTASYESIKQAYRRLAAVHHPDKGGDTAVFQSIVQAYGTLADPVLRLQYDLQHSNVDPIDQWFESLDTEFNSTFSNSQHALHNKNIHIQVSVSLAQSYTGVEIETSYTLSSGNTQTVRLNIPEGVIHGQLVKFMHLGDDLYPLIPRGDLIAQVSVVSEENFVRRGNDLLTLVNITPIEAMIGCSKVVYTLDGVGFEITIAPGTQSGSELVVANLGFKTGHSRRGNFCAVVNISVPAVTARRIRSALEKVQAMLDS